MAGYDDYSMSNNANYKNDDNKMTRKEYIEKMVEDKQSFIHNVIEYFTKGEIFWRKPWVVGQANMLFQNNPVTGTAYSGINFLRLYFEVEKNNYSDNRWLTFKNIKEKGYTLEKGAKGVAIYKWTEYDRATKTVPDWEKIEKLEKENREKYIKENIYSGMSYSGTVFNGNKIKSLPELSKSSLWTETEIKKLQNEEIPAIELILENSVPIEYTKKGVACYIPTIDKINLPERENFISKESFYSTALHEVAHSTGHQSRLNRDLSGAFGCESYAKEELRAELSSVFLSLELGKKISPLVADNNSKYLASWYLTLLQNDDKEFFKAVKDAENIAKYVITHYAEKKKLTSVLVENNTEKIQEMFGGVRKHKASDKQNTKLDNNIKE